MPCIYGDQELRVQLTKGGVIHAGTYQNFGGFTRHDWKSGVTEFIPKRRGIRIACSWDEIPESKLVDKKEKITCKNCMKRMGLDESPLSPQRFVVRRKDTGEFMKNTGTRCSGWSNSITDAFFFKRKHTALDKCKLWRYKAGNVVLTYSEWVAKGRPKNFKRVKIYDPNLEIRPVKFELEDPI